MSYYVEKDWITAVGLRAVVIVCKSGERKTHRCGYVGVPETSKLFQVGYSQQIPEISQEAVSTQVLGKKSSLLILTATVNADDEGNIRRSPDILFDVHGGITYSGGKDDYPVQSNLWWFGFDCHHYGDQDIEPDPGWRSFYAGEVRELAYVEAECESLARQIKESGL